MDLMLSNTASGLVDDIKATLRDFIYNNVAVLNSVSLKALSNEHIVTQLAGKSQCFRKLCFPITTFQHVFCELDYGSSLTFSTLVYC